MVRLPIIERFEVNVLSPTTVFIIGGFLCVAGACLFVFPTKFAIKRKGIPPPIWLDRNWMYVTPQRVRVMGIFFFLLGAIISISKIIEMARLEM